MKQYEIAVCIPSLNEENTIGHVTKTIARGLNKYFPNKKSVLINADSNSTDNTRAIFLNSHTDHIEKTYINSTRLGKGLNIMNFVKFALSQKIPYLAMFDADLKSISPDWINKMLSPIIYEKVDFITPIYTRNPYEGNTTNHLCYPVLSALFGSSIRQPIGGDFAFSLKYAKNLIKEIDNEYSLAYGIDITMTMTAILSKLKISQVDLGKKIHNPSFGKMIPMFKQVTSSLIYMLNKHAPQICNYGVTSTIKKVEALATYKIIRQSPDNLAIAKRRAELKTLYSKTKFKYLKTQYSNLELSITKGKYYTSDMWTSTLEELLRVVIHGHIKISDIEVISSELLVYYLSRVLTYFQELKKDNYENIIYNQASLLINKLLKKPLCPIQK